MQINQDAWKLLLEDEKIALSMQHGMDKSSWEVGEIMGRSHYKYLEIKYRAEHFLKMFTEHLELFDVVFPEYITGNRLVISYFRLCIEKRHKPMLSLSILFGEFGKIPKVYLNDQIVQQFKKWEREDNAYNKACLEIIKEFDRWNNFRILPKEIQEPSAFKRRIKNCYKKQIRVTHQLHELSIAKLNQVYGTKKSPAMYIGLANGGKITILRLKINKGSLGILNTIGLYAFKDTKTAEQYIHDIFHYIGKGKKDCIDGLDFWPKFRDTIQLAVNYNEVMNISPNRKFLQLAMEKLEYV